MEAAPTVVTSKLTRFLRLLLISGPLITTWQFQQDSTMRREAYGNLKAERLRNQEPLAGESDCTNYRLKGRSDGDDADTRRAHARPSPKSRSARWVFRAP